MELQQAINLLANDYLHPAQPQHWADLGCGKGTFTIALAALLKTGSTIYAVDKDKAALDQLPTQANGVEIKKQVADFASPHISYKNLDGIIMANSLHYVNDKFSFMERAGGWLKPAGYLLVVEYDTDRANQWVPWPIDFLSLEKLFQSLGFSFTRKIAEQSSIFGRAKLYSAITKR